MAALSAESSCPGSGHQAGGVGTWPCVSDPGSRAAAAAAAEPPLGVDEVFGQHNVLDLGMAGQGKASHYQLHGLETSCGVEECRLVASRGGQCEDHT